MEKQIVSNLTLATHPGGEQHIFVTQQAVALDCQSKIQSLKSAVVFGHLARCMQTIYCMVAKDATKMSLQNCRSIFMTNCFLCSRTLQSFGVA